MRNIIILISVMFINIYMTEALTDEEMKARFMKIMLECHKEHPVPMSELLHIEKLVVPQKAEVKCLLACTYKREGIMTEKGLFNLEHAYELAEIVKNGNEQRLINAKKIGDICVKVNEETVSDGEKGCDRAGLMFKCVIDHAPKAKTDEELKAEFIKILMKCTETNPVEMSELMQLQNLVVPKKTEPKCLLACSYRTLGTLDDKGMYDVKRAYAIAETEKAEDPKAMANAKKLADICTKVNEAEVADKEKGCDRAALMFECLIQHGPKLGFKL